MAVSRGFTVRLWLLGVVSVGAGLAGAAGFLAGSDWSAGYWAPAVLVGVLVILVVAVLFWGISVVFRGVARARRRRSARTDTAGQGD